MRSSIFSVKLPDKTQEAQDICGASFNLIYDVSFVIYRTGFLKFSVQSQRRKDVSSMCSAKKKVLNLSEIYNYMWCELVT